MFSISAPKRQRRRALAMALTKVPAGEGAAHGILVNFLHVGLIDSDQWVQRHTLNPHQPYTMFCLRMFFSRSPNMNIRFHALARPRCVLHRLWPLRCKPPEQQG